MIKQFNIPCFKTVVVLLTTVFLLFTTMFFTLNIFVESTVISKLYAFICGTIICFSTFIFYRKTKIITDKLLIILGIFIEYIIIRGTLSGVADIKILLLVSFFLLFIYFRSINNKQNDINITIVIVCLSQAIYGLMQYLQIFPIYVPFNMLGSFDNPAGFAMCIALGYPFALSLFKNRGIKRYLGVISAITILIAVILSESRTGMIAILLSSIIYLFDKLRNKINFRIFIPLLSIIVIAVCILLFFYKKDSAIGRMLIWKNSIAMMSDRPILGHGTNGFESKYMLYQADFFENHQDSVFSQLADNISHPFNEFLLLGTEFGIIGLALLSSILIITIISYRVSLTILMVLISLFVFGCFSYPLRYGFVLAIIAYCLSTLESRKIYLMKSIILPRLLFAFLIILISIFLVRDIIFERKWNSLLNLSYHKEYNVLNDYNVLYKNWNGDHFFLYNYGAILNSKEKYSASNKVINNCINYFNDYDVQMLFADNYFKIQNYDNAIIHYNLAANMVPNRFTPLYGLWESYKEQGNIAKALEIAKHITTKKVKIPSSAIDNYQLVINNFIENNR